MKFVLDFLSTYKMITLPNLFVSGTMGGSGTAHRAPVRAATVVAGTLATSFANGQSIDGVVLATDNRILIQNQASAIENGIYIVQAAGAPIRASDCEAGTSMSGIIVTAREGTVNALMSFICSTLSPNDIVGTNSLTFVANVSTLSKTLTAGNQTGGNNIIFTGTDTLRFTRTNNLIIDAATITTTNRMLTLPDPLGNDSFVYAALAQTLTNKTISSATNSVGANHLRTTGANVNVDAAAPPTTGQILRATSATTATWQTGENVYGSFEFKPSVRVATVIAGTLATSFANGQTVDGITLVTADRILIKNQASGVENGIYVVTAGTPTRAADMPVGLNARASFVIVQVGTNNNDTGFVCANAGGTDVVGTHALVFTSVTIQTPNSATNRSVPRFSGTSGMTIQGSTLIVADTGEIIDSAGNELLGWSSLPSAINYLGIGNAPINTGPRLFAFGDDTNINLHIVPKGQGTVNFITNDATTNVETRYFDNGSINYMGIRAPSSVSSSYTMTWPTAQGAAGQVLQAQGGGVLDWLTPSIGMTQVTSTTAVSTSSTTYVLITGMTVAPAAGTYWVSFSGSFGIPSTTGVTFYCTIYSGGVQVTHSERTMWNISVHVHSVELPCHTQALVTVNGSQAVEVRYRASAANSITARARSMLLIRQN